MKEVGLRMSVQDESPEAAEVTREIVAGLESRPPSLPCRLFYDEKGAALFEQITELPEYYLTRAEIEILETHAREIARAIGPHAFVIEPGTGDGRKIRLLLNALDRPRAYVPIDVSREQLASVSAAISRDYPLLDIFPICADFTRDVNMPFADNHQGRAVAFFPGSTIGNFEPETACRFLARLRKLVGAKGAVLVGVDLRKDPSILEAAYNDRAGVTSAFNKNVLTRLRRDCGAQVESQKFRHRAIWVEEKSRIEMHLVANSATAIQVGRHVFPFAAGEFIVTEHCHKYDVNSFAVLSRAAGLRVARVWKDAQENFALFLFDASDPAMPVA